MQKNPVENQPEIWYDYHIKYSLKAGMPVKKTFITHMPDKAGAFLSASRIISMAGGNITRVSYNKAIDLHMLFLEVSAEKAQLDQIENQLTEIGYIQNEQEPGQTILIEFRLLDIPNSVRVILELINRYAFNITYISSQENATEYQNIKIGLYVRDQDSMRRFLDEAARLCELRILDYDRSQQILDNTVFYLSFARQVSDMLGLSKTQENELIADSNRIMQNLDERSSSPYKTFSYIGKFAEMLHSYKSDGFCSIVSQRKLQDDFTLHCIEPPCGSNSYIFEKDGELLFIDCGFTCYEEEMLLIFRSLFPEFDCMRKSLILTHPDIDHCGLAHLFDKIYVSAEAYRNFSLEDKNEPNFREQNPLHAPYCRISKILSGYSKPDLHKLVILGEDRTGDPLIYTGNFDFHGLRFDIYAGNGGHNRGEIVLCNEKNKLVFTGDIVVNIKGFSKEQADFNALAPYLMTSVNMDSPLATAERLAVQERFDQNFYTYCCGHGAIMEPKS